jgi:hypothetical protein
MKKSLLSVLTLVLATSLHADWTESFEVGSKHAPKVTQAPTHVPTAVPTEAPTQVKTAVATPVTPPAPVVVPTAAPVPVVVPTFTVSGYVDVNAGLNVTNPNSISNGLHLGTGLLSIQASDTAARGALLQVIYGENAAAFTSFNAGQSTPNIKQAYLYQSLGNLTIQAGKMIGFLGYELPDPNLNLNYTRSALFYAEPVYHMALAAKYAVNDVTNLIVYGANENSSDSSLDETKDFGASIQSLGTTAGAAVNWYRDNYLAGTFEHRDLINAYTYYTLGGCTLAVEYLHGDMYLNSGAGYIGFGGEQLSLAVRGVYVSNPGTLPGDSSSQYTMTIKHKNGNITNALDIIYDVSPLSIYTTANGNAQNNQQSLVLSSVYSF